MIEWDASILIGGVFLVGGIALIVVATYEWYHQKKRVELMKLEEIKS
ncbi:MAG: hypothetical protein MUO73_00995 [Thermoplasmata archaeon]|nr:hypothetical protein [Thermoplasmata archaeon]